MEGGFERRDIDLLHLHHGRPRAGRRRGIGIVEQPRPLFRRDLPGDAEKLGFDPAAPELVARRSMIREIMRSFAASSAMSASFRSGW
jgi:hypothetical protein